MTDPFRSPTYSKLVSREITAARYDRAVKSGCTQEIKSIGDKLKQLTNELMKLEWT